APLGTHIADPIDRLEYVFSQTTNSKAMSDAIGARNMTEMSKVSPALFMALAAQAYTRLGLANRVALPFTTVVTNVPGPPVPIYSAGARLESMMGLLCLTDGLGLGHVVQSYVKEATIAFTACRNLLPDPEFYAQCIEDSFHELRDAAAKVTEPRIPQAGPLKKPKPAVKTKKPAPKAAAKPTANKKPASKKPAAKSRKAIKK
ncbi:MAG: WSD1 family O-acyltransferase, partial [Novosphingobium sp.]